MARYTLTIKDLIDNNFNFGLQEYPIFDENYRNILNQKIINHYYMSEIGFETANLFKFYLNNKMNEIMPYYNELYKVEKNIIDNELILNNVNLTETFNESNLKNDSNNSNITNNTTNNSNITSNDRINNSGTDRNLFQDTPQGQLDTTDINSQKWATNLTLNDRNNSSFSNNQTNETNSTNNTINQNNTLTSNNTNEYIKKIIGNNGNKFTIDVLNDVKDKLINIDMMIINDLNDLFMGIF